METVNVIFAILLATPIALGAGFAVYRGRALRRTRQLELELARAEGVGGIGSRVRMLERIVTDKGIGIAAQIEALREEPPFEGSSRNG